ncbi:MAG: hypothetical protein ACRD2U_03130 [Terriglobales bacterium]
MDEMSATSAGTELRILRGRLGLTMRDVERASVKIAENHSNTEFLIPPSRLSDIETKEIIPTIYRFYSLAAIYHQDMRTLLSWFGVDLNDIPGDADVAMPAKTHIFDSLSAISTVNMPIRLDPGFDTRYTSSFTRFVERWGIVPVACLKQFLTRQYTYGYVGAEDFTMYPILHPGTFVQIDESKTEIIPGPWSSEYARPIYFVETREGYCCCWCTLRREELILQPHPLSSVNAQFLKYPHDAEVIGQVVGIAMRLEDWRIE